MFAIRFVFVLALAFSVRVFAADEQCNADYERGRREMSAYAEMLGVIEGTIYGHTLSLASTNICLAGSPKEKVQAIAKAIASDSFAKKPILMDDVPTKEQAIEFLQRFFPCK